ncbi:MAG: beta-hydroxyacyl-ACP dehydratase [Planctomycetota bacterium]|nr:beta-hydroxyacyl-ACP dehydratase [Planctomycetota bacterium]
MRFILADKIESIEPGKRIVTIKALSLAEEYLADHFPIFPVLPGVLMIEAMVQSAAWLVRVQQNFTMSIIVLRTARNVRYSSFVAPGNFLRCELEAVSIGDDAATFKGSGHVGDTQVVSGRLELKCFNLAEQGGSWRREADESILSQMRTRFRLVGGPEAMAAAQAAPA